MNVVQLVHGDCLDKLSEIDDNSIDCIITDPPYFIDKLKQNDKWNPIMDSNSHIKHLPKGMKFDKSQSIDLYEYYLKLCKIIYPKLKSGGYFLSFSSPRLYHSIAKACDDAGFEIRDMINWVYTQSMPKGMSMSHILRKKGLSGDIIEQYQHLKTPQLRSCFEPICVAMKPVCKSFIHNEMTYHTGLLDFEQKVGSTNERVPANIITTDIIDDIYDKNFLVSKPTKKEKGVYNTHITVKPIQLLEHLVKLFTREGALVVDPFMGSGTTALACKRTNRRCIGIEISKEYFDIAIKRVSEQVDCLRE